MEYYINIHIHPMAELADAHILNTLYAKLHLQLATLDMTSIGVSFPEVNNKKHTLGRCLRLHGNKTDLETLISTRWMDRLHDYATASALRPIPEDTQYRIVKRVQVKSSPERLRRRAMKRHGLTEQQAKEKIPDSITKKTTLPFINMQSSSTSQRFKLFIQHDKIQNKPTTGPFSAYGLSQTATIPWF